MRFGRRDGPEAPQQRKWMPKVYWNRLTGECIAVLYVYINSWTPLYCCTRIASGLWDRFRVPAFYIRRSPWDFHVYLVHQVLTVTNFDGTWDWERTELWTLRASYRWAFTIYNVLDFVLWIKEGLWCFEVLVCERDCFELKKHYFLVSQPTN